MAELNIGDQVEFQVRLVPCIECKEEKALLYPDSHYFIVDRGNPVGFICAKCAVTDAQRALPVGDIQCVLEEIPLPEPVAGNYRPVVKQTIIEQGIQKGYWEELGQSILETMAMWQGKVLKFNASANRFKGIWVKPMWQGTKVTGFVIAGDTPTKKLELDVYQLHRLRRMGFVEEGKTNKTWSIELSKPEQGIVNASSIILSVLKQGYLLESTDLYAFNPTLDINVDDPEYRHLKGKSQEED
ncbi:MAG: hypothetical protein RLZZ579_137 [Actinomycetota bacterium]|jgi:hypothetical protein